jgi:hypothetical protein
MSVTSFDVDLRKWEMAIDLRIGCRFENLKKHIDLRYRCLWSRNQLKAGSQSESYIYTVKPH